MYQVEDIRGFLKDPDAAAFNPEVVRDLLKHYDNLVEEFKKLDSLVSDLEAELRAGDPL